MRTFLSSFIILTTFLASLIAAETHTWYFKTGWVDANPDGVYPRKMIGFNDSWPLPTLRVKKGDRVQLYLINGFDNLNTTLHFHGLFVRGANQMDGPEMVTSVLSHLVKHTCTTSLLLIKWELIGITVIQGSVWRRYERCLYY